MYCNIKYICLSPDLENLCLENTSAVRPWAVAGQRYFSTLGAKRTKQITFLALVHNVHKYVLPPLENLGWLVKMFLM